MRDFCRIRVPNPYGSGVTNCYLIRREPVTLIDCGADDDAGPAALRAGLAEQGLTLRDIRRLLITHAHPDHIGFALQLQQESGAEILLHRLETEKATERLRELYTLGEHLLAGGVPPREYETLREYFRWECSFVGPLECFTALEDGDEIAFDGFSLRAVHTPGHAAGHLCWYEPESETLFCGDAVLAAISPNPTLEPDDGFKNGRAPVLRQYEATLERLAALPVRSCLPGHGRRIGDFPAALRRLRAHNAQRIETVRVLLRETPHATAYELARRMFTHLGQPVDLYLAMCEVIAVLDRLSDPDPFQTEEALPQ